MIQARNCLTHIDGTVALLLWRTKQWMHELKYSHAFLFLPRLWAFKHLPEGLPAGAKLYLLSFWFQVLDIDAAFCPMDCVTSVFVRHVFGSWSDEERHWSEIPSRLPEVHWPDETARVWLAEGSWILGALVCGHLAQEALAWSFGEPWMYRSWRRNLFWHHLRLDLKIHCPQHDSLTYKLLPRFAQDPTWPPSRSQFAASRILPNRFLRCIAKPVNVAGVMSC